MKPAWVLRLHLRSPLHHCPWIGFCGCERAASPTLLCKTDGSSITLASIMGCIGVEQNQYGQVKKSNKLTWPSSAGLMLQEMSFFKESASALLIHPTPRCFVLDLLFLVLSAEQGKAWKSKIIIQVKRIVMKRTFQTPSTLYWEGEKPARRGCCRQDLGNTKSLQNWT